MVDSIKEYELLGVRLHAMTRTDVVRAVAAAVRSKQRCVIGNHNLHSMYLWGRDARMRSFYRIARYAHIDGTSLIWLGRVLGLPLRAEHRTGYIDLLPMLLDEATRSGWRVFYLGSEPSVAARGAAILRARYPGLTIATCGGYFDPSREGPENAEVVEAINRSAADVLLVGMGMPRQEVWLLENLSDLHASATLCCGAMMELVTGDLVQAPRWLGPIGLEWAFRLCVDPKRLWRRYLLEPWLIARSVMLGYRQSGRLTLAPK